VLKIITNIIKGRQKLDILDGRAAELAKPRDGVESWDFIRKFLVALEKDAVPQKIATVSLWPRKEAADNGCSSLSLRSSTGASMLKKHQQQSLHDVKDWKMVNELRSQTFKVTLKVLNLQWDVSSCLWFRSTAASICSIVWQSTIAIHADLSFGLWPFARTDNSSNVTASVKFFAAYFQFFFPLLPFLQVTPNNISWAHVCILVRSANTGPLTCGLRRVFVPLFAHLTINMRSNFLFCGNLEKTGH
jgi:hypothetical protein